MVLNTKNITNISELNTGTRIQLSSEISSMKGGLNKQDLIDKLKGVFNTVIEEKCSSFEDIEQCEKAFLLAIKSIQENLNHEGQTGYFTKENYYGDIQGKGKEFFEEFTSKENLNKLKLVCYHKNAFCFTKNRKYCFFGSTNYTESANKLREYVKNQADDAKFELTFKLELKKNFEDISKKFGKRLINKLCNKDIKQVLKEIKKPGVKQCRFGKIYAEKNRVNTVTLIILDENRSYISNGTWGGSKLIKIANYAFILNNLQCEHFINGLVDLKSENITQFVSLSRKRNRCSRKLLKRDGFNPIKILDRRGNEKIIYVKKYLGKNLRSVINPHMPEEEFNSLVKSFLNEVLSKNAEEKIYDIKIGNTLYLNGKINLIDYSDPTFTPSCVLGEQNRLLQEAINKSKSQFETAIRENQENLLWANIAITIRNIFELKYDKSDKEFRSFIESLKKRFIGFKKFVNENSRELGI